MVDAVENATQRLAAQVDRLFLTKEQAGGAYVSARTSAIAAEAFANQIKQILEDIATIDDAQIKVSTRFCATPPPSFFSLDLDS